MSDVLKKFGRYFLLDQLAQGGMAEIYRARLAAADGAGRLLVIKRIQAGFGANNEFLQMFRSETKMMMGFNHPNIVQLYDYGEEDNQPYIAMECIDGRNLRQFMTRFNELKQPFPIELAATIAEQTACGLHYAHSFRDKISGEPLDIVHRDISPQNILISYEGNVKVIDFGIAKATTNMESTRAGVIKGKPSYLSPEQISGEVLDGRCDIFALGTVLWELLAGKKLFAGENDLAVLKLIESASAHVKPPSTLNPKVPKELDYIVLRALAKQREKRYQTAEEMQRALHKFLYSFAPEFNPSDLSYYARDLFKNDIVEDRKRIQRLNDKVEQLLAKPEAASSEIIRGHAEPSDDGIKLAKTEKEDTTTVVEPRNVSTGAREAFEVDQVKNAHVELDQVALRRSTGVRSRSGGGGARTLGTDVHLQRPSRSTAPQQQQTSANKKSLTRNALRLAVAVIAAVLLAPEVGIQIPYVSDWMNDLTGSGQARLVLQGNQKGVSVEVNGAQVADHLPTTVQGVPVGRPFLVTVRGPEGSFSEEVILHKGEHKSVPVQLGNENRSMASFGSAGSAVAGGATAAVIPQPLSAQPAAPASNNVVTLRLNVQPGGGANVMLNGRPIDASRPIPNVPLDTPLELSADRQGFRSFHREFVLESSQIHGLKEWLIDVPMEPIQFGFLTLHTTPSAEATIEPEGTRQPGSQPWTKKTPIEGEKLAVGNYRIRLVNEVLGMEKVISVTIQDRKVVNIEAQLEVRPGN